MKTKWDWRKSERKIALAKRIISELHTEPLSAVAANLSLVKLISRHTEQELQVKLLELQKT